MKPFSQLTEREILALAIDAEDDDHRVYSAFAEDLGERYPGTAKMFAEMADVEQSHHDTLLKTYREKFGKNLLPIRRADVSGFMKRRPIWLVRNLPLSQIRSEVALRETEAYNFYIKAASQAKDPAIRKLLGDLAEIEKGHEAIAADVETEYLTPQELQKEDARQRRNFILRYVQPGLAGLMDGSVSTLAPLFAAAFATHNNWSTFLVGLAASIGAGISMAFAEALSDDGAISGRGAPWLRGPICGAMTALGGLGHTLPYLVPNSLPNAFAIATGISGIVVFFELWAIAWVRAHYMDTPLLQAIFQIVLGGVIVLLTGILIGNA
ncbi:rubrerythrin [Methylovirgula ligni]|uniref:Rubrerythrin n=1 Tax=Methylovirgula ligni TaxID=569860 RepID=A0A3D9YV98_9HYPH|nr:ferritin family protein [Methylovirgula ligni]QAY94799.1 rubrerythrin [Methylovirgula ligni]REF84782.1 rubrerythrin [Methylovirgula ligni]